MDLTPSLYSRPCMQNKLDRLIKIFLFSWRVADRFPSKLPAQNRFVDKISSDISDSRQKCC